jgi:poly(beta-D-mannuronate) lyase
MVRLLAAGIGAFLLGQGAAVGGDVERFCRATVPLSGYSPVLQMRGAASYGSDRAAEPFVLAVMNAAAAWIGLNDESAAQVAISELRRWAIAGALEHVAEVGPTASNTNSIYSLRRTLIPLLAAWEDLSSVASKEDRRLIEAWLSSLVTLQDTHTGGGKARGLAISNRNNHAYLRATVDALWGLRAGDNGRVTCAQQAVADAVRTMRDDGSLPLETMRGSRALWYQRHAVASLVYIAELLRVRGYDVWATLPDGRSLHDAVGFLVRGIADPAIVASYAAANANPKPGTSPEVQDLGFLEPRPNGRHYMAWVELYASAFPASAHTPALLRSLRPSFDAARPLLDDLVGGNATCRISLGRR